LLYQDIKERRDEDLLVLPTDAVLFEDASFKVKQNEVWL
jgi:L-ascorbate peroxidase